MERTQLINLLIWCFTPSQPLRLSQGVERTQCAEKKELLVRQLNLFYTDLSLKTEALEGTQTEIPGGGGKRRLYLMIHCHHQMISALRWTAMRGVLTFHSLCEKRSQK